MKGIEDTIPGKKSLDSFYEIGSHAEESVFTPENLVDIAIKQKGLVKDSIPSICILDPDGDIVRYLVKSGRAKKSKNWPCYHTDMYLFSINEIDLGIVGPLFWQFVEREDSRDRADRHAASLSDDGSAGKRALSETASVGAGKTPWLANQAKHRLYPNTASLI